MHENHRGTLGEAPLADDVFSSSKENLIRAIFTIGQSSESREKNRPTKHLQHTSVKNRYFTHRTAPHAPRTIREEAFRRTPGQAHIPATGTRWLYRHLRNGTIAGEEGASAGEAPGIVPDGALVINTPHDGSCRSYGAEGVDAFSAAAPARARARTSASPSCCAPISATSQCQAKPSRRSTNSTPNTLAPDIPRTEEGTVASMRYAPSTGKASNQSTRTHLDSGSCSAREMQSCARMWSKGRQCLCPTAAIVIGRFHPP